MNDSTFKLIQYAQTPLPLKPKIAPWVSIINIGDDRIHLRGAEMVVPLLHPLFIETFYKIKPLLDGKHSVEEITTIGGEQILPTTIEFLLKMLRSNGILQEGQSNSKFDENNPEIEDIRQFFSHYTQNPDGMVLSLSQTKIGIIGKGRLKESIKNIALNNQIKNILDFSINDIDGPNLEEKFKGLDSILACSENPDHSFFEKVNQLCLKTGTRWIHVSIEGTTAFIGPTIIPHQTACFHCYTKRVLSNSTDPEGLIAYQNHFQKNDFPKNEGILPTFLDLVANETILDLIRLTTGFAPPATIGRLLQLKPENQKARGHDIFRLPRCPICTPRKNHQEIWNLDSLIETNEFK